MKLWVINIYRAAESNCINSGKTNPARGTDHGSTDSVSWDSSLGCPHEVPAGENARAALCREGRGAAGSAARAPLPCLSLGVPAATGSEG